ncbi:hypothetical protein NKH18_15770 [Streptomyces sp. M10(2022)]
MEIRRAHEPPDALIIGEPSGCDTVVLGYKGKLDLRYHVRCEATHPSNVVPKASELAARAWTELLDLLGPEASHARFDSPGPTLTSIDGGLTSATAEFSIRIPGLRRREPGDRAVRAAGPGHAPGRQHRARLPRRSQRPGGAGAVGRDPRAGRQPEGEGEDRHLRHEHTGGAVERTDGHLRAGDSSLDHSDREHIKLSEYLFGIRVLTRALAELDAHLTGENR